ncbi:hypothetical protein LCGC14_1179750 [marine sediment metagenome]|uniref:Uncharacterized protein n=1 Tax=marine sediment metagenome TaxID=412755 RepID=A0A0F9LSC4_9ZZZZ
MLIKMDQSTRTEALKQVKGIVSAFAALAPFDPDWQAGDRPINNKQRGWIRDVNDSIMDLVWCINGIGSDIKGL